MEQSRNGRPVPASARGGPCTPEPRRYSHPIERRREGQCEPVQSILCALAGQNQVLCAMKAELDEILELSDQIAVIYEGECMGVVRDRDATKEGIGLLMAGVKGTQAATAS